MLYRESKPVSEIITLFYQKSSMERANCFFLLNLWLYHGLFGYCKKCFISALIDIWIFLIVIFFIFLISIPFLVVLIIWNVIIQSMRIVLPHQIKGYTW